MRESIRAAGRVLGLTVGLVALPAAALADTVEEHGGAGVEVGVEITTPTDAPTGPGEPTSPGEPSPTETTTDPGETVPTETPTSDSGELGQTGFGGAPLLLATAGVVVVAGAATLAVRRRAQHR